MPALTKKALAASKKSTVVKKAVPAKKVAAEKKVPVTKKSVAKHPAAKVARHKLSDHDMLSNFFIGELEDIYWAEKHLLKVLVKMEKSATAAELKLAFANHREVTQQHAARLEQIFGLLNIKPTGKKCEAMAGITKEGDEIISNTRRGSETRDVGLIFAGQKVEHYEIATYGSLAQLARTLGLEQIATIFDQTLSEEKEADAALTKLAVKNINEEASHEKEPPHEAGFVERILNMIS